MPYQRDLLSKVTFVFSFLIRLIFLLQRPYVNTTFAFGFGFGMNSDWICFSFCGEGHAVAWPLAVGSNI